MAASAVTPIVTRSRGRFCIRATNPPPSVPSRLAAGTRTSVKNSSEVSCVCMPIGQISRHCRRLRTTAERRACSIGAGQMATNSPGQGHATELTGRRSERKGLDRLIEAVRAGESRALVVVGEPGVGKTALLDYLAGQAGAAG